MSGTTGDTMQPNAKYRVGYESSLPRNGVLIHRLLFVTQII